MKKLTLITSLLLSVLFFAQNKSSYLQADTFYGNIINTTPDATIFLQGHPTGVFVSYNKRSYGEEQLEEHYNYPDFGISAGYQNYQSNVLGELYSLYGHYNWYLLNRKSASQLILRTGLGLAYSTKPYDKETNNKNIAFGSHLNSSSYLKLYFQQNNIIENLGVNAGFTFIHASNSNIKSPNSGVNVWGVTVGLNYELEPETSTHTYIPSNLSRKFTEPIKLNLNIRGGINESEIIGSGVKPFFVFSAYADKRVSRKSAIQLGADYYISPILEDYYNLNLTIPHTNLKETNDFSRIGIFVGHELFLNKVSLETQFGYYVKYPFEYEGQVYETIGLKRYFNNKWYGSLRLKAHAANAETVEFGIGVRL